MRFELPNPRLVGRINRRDGPSNQQLAALPTLLRCVSRCRYSCFMRLGWLVGAAILVVACSTTPVPSSSAKPIPAGRIRAPEFTHAQEGFALVVVTRDKSLTVLACTAHLHVDGILVADLRPSEQIRLFLDEGQHLVGVSADGCIGGADQTSINVSRARPVLLRIAARRGQGLKIELSAF